MNTKGNHNTLKVARWLSPSIPVPSENVEKWINAICRLQK